MKIYLIGMPGAGKSTVGRELARTLSYDFVDLDGLIAKKGLMFAEDIIERYGIETFRKLETESLASISGNNLVIACGGGVIENMANKDLMDGIIIYLDVNNNIIEARLENDYMRPLLKTKTLEQIYEERFLKYQHFAKHIIANNKDVNTTVANIIETIGKNYE